MPFRGEFAGPKHFSGWKPIKRSTYKVLLEQHKKQPYLTPEQVAHYQTIVGPEKKTGNKRGKQEKNKVNLPASVVAELKKIGVDWKE